jgi:hypothetical protein
MQVRRILVALVAATGGAVLASPAAHAGPYVPGISPPPTIVAPPTVQAGVPFMVTGSGFAANETVTLTIDVTVTGASFQRSAPRLIPAAFVPALAPQTVVTTANAVGEISVQVTVPQTGTVSITAVGSVSNSPVEAPVNVIPAQPAAATSPPAAAEQPSGGLVQTGSNIALPAVLGAAIVVAGALLVWLAVPRRRRRQEQSSADAG